jgi:hypothetical protein
MGGGQFHKLVDAAVIEGDLVGWKNFTNSGTLKDVMIK